MPNELCDFLGAHEGGYHDPYNIGYDGSKLGSYHNFSKMTIAEIHRRQHLSLDNPEYLHAVGKYQIVQGTTDELIKKYHINTKLNFTPETQENIFSDVLITEKRHVIKQYIVNQSGLSLLATQKAIAKEWTSVEYPGHHGLNYWHETAQIKLRDVDQALNTMRAEYQRAIHNGATPENAWREVTGRAPVPTKTIDPPAHSASAAMSPTDSDHRNPPGQSNNLGFQLDPDVQRILDAMHNGDPTRIDAAFRQNMENHFASPQGQAFRLDVEAQAQQMRQTHEQAAQQQEVQQQSGPTRGMSR